MKCPGNFTPDESVGRLPSVMLALEKAGSQTETPGRLRGFGRSGAFSFGKRHTVLLGRAGTRAVPMLPALRRLLATWKLRSENAKDNDLVIATVDGAPVQERNLRRVLDDAKADANMGDTDARLSWHSLRHSFASMLATDLELPATTLARLTGHKDAGFTLKVYARDGRDHITVVADVLARAAAARVGK